MSKVRVLVVDDSALVRKLLAEILGADPEIEVVGTAADAMIAWRKIQTLRPDVLTLDIEMPGMNGLVFLDKLVRARPMPVVMISSLTERGAYATVRALDLGAIDFVTKPRIDLSSGTVRLAAEIVEKVKAAARARVRRRSSPLQVAGGAARPRPAAAAGVAAPGLIAIGASTGGIEALRVVLSALPADVPGVVVVQHISAGYTAALAEHLDQLSAIHVVEARNGEPVLAGHAYIAPGDYHMRVARAAGGLTVQVTDEPRRNHHRPSVDTLFESVARAAGERAVAAILTGMGSDGARGMLDLRHAGAHTIAQDEATSVVFGMPREAIALEAAAEVRPLDEIAGALVRGARRVRA